MWPQLQKLQLQTLQNFNCAFHVGRGQGTQRYRIAFCYYISSNKIFLLKNLTTNDGKEALEPLQRIGEARLVLVTCRVFACGEVRLTITKHTRPNFPPCPPSASRALSFLHRTRLPLRARQGLATPSRRGPRSMSPCRCPVPWNPRAESSLWALLGHAPSAPSSLVALAL